MSERNKFNIGDVSAEISEILNSAKNSWSLALSGLQNTVNTTKTGVEKTLAGSRERITPAIDTATTIATTAKNLGSTALSRLLRRSSDIGDRPRS